MNRAGTYKKNYINNERGFTLISLITTLGLASIATLIALSLIQVTQTYAIQSRNEMNALRMSISMEYNLRKYISLAVRVVPEGTRGANNRLGEFNTVDDCTILANCPGTSWREVAFFNRENSTGGLGTVSELGLAPTWIWYKGPIHDPANHLNSSPGLLVIDNGSSAINGVPEASDIFFNALSYFNFNPISTGTSVSQVQVEARFRYHGITRVQSWCPREAILAGTCNYTSGEVPNYLDKEITFNILLVNNILEEDIGDGSNLEVRPLGPIHFFKSINPTRVF